MAKINFSATQVTSDPADVPVVVMGQGWNVQWHALHEFPNLAFIFTQESMDTYSNYYLALTLY